MSVRLASLLHAKSRQIEHITKQAATTSLLVDELDLYQVRMEADVFVRLLYI